jgi:hypothetical protein
MQPKRTYEVVADAAEGDMLGQIIVAQDLTGHGVQAGVGHLGNHLALLLNKLNHPCSHTPAHMSMGAWQEAKTHLWRSKQQCAVQWCL